MKKNRLLLLIFGGIILALTVTIIIVTTSFFENGGKSAEGIELDTNIVESAADMTDEEVPHTDGASGITSEYIDVLSPEQSQAVVDMAVCFTAFMPEANQNNIVFSRSTILNYLSVYCTAFADPDKEIKSYSYSQLENMAQELFGCPIPSALPDDDTAYPGWTTANGGLFPAADSVKLGTARLISAKSNSDLYTVQIDIANCSWQSSSVYRMSIEFSENPDSPTGFGFQSISFIQNHSKAIADIEASSEKPAVNEISFTAANCIDGSLSTVWCENATGNGVLEWIKLYPADNITFSAIGIVNGNVSSQKSYYENGRIKNILIQFPGGYTISETVSDDCFNNDGAPYTVLLGSDIQASWVKITIESIYEGDVYNDICIAEIKLY